ncbi:hypothetical protein [Streptomyces sp. NPDC047014]|uniref:hypothetical protein n=1 Tax=Streptomyces sp. NPDC047014 TaxID=3155736 RepID=UPI0033FCDB30
MSRARHARRRRIGTLAAVTAACGLLAAGQAASAAVPGGNVLINWSIPDAPSDGVQNLTFPITVNPATTHQRGLYFAQMFAYTGNGLVGYTGLQPRPDTDGHEQLRGVFSIFGPGASTTDPNCYDGADGDDGVSCATEFAGVYGHTYDLSVDRTGPDTWSGTATDTVTGASHHIGTFTLPGGGNLASSQLGFVEYYLGVPSCRKMPRTDVVFGAPRTTDADGRTGTSTAAYEYGACVGKARYEAESDGHGGTHVTRGNPGSR